MGFFKSDKHKSVVYLLSYFYVKNFVWFSVYKKLLGNWNVLLIVLKYILKVLGMYLRANLFKNQADLYWRVIYDPLGFAWNFFGWKA